MHVSWDWIKQRPHFLAEGLAENNEVTVVYRNTYRKRRLVKNPVAVPLVRKALFALPLGARFRVIDWMNDLIMRWQLKKTIREAEVVWITYPTLFAVISPYLLPKQKVVYDCMDDYSSFPSVLGKPSGEKIRASERKLCQRSDLILASSAFLANRLSVRYKIDLGSINIVNNAIKLVDDCSCSTGQGGFKEGKKRLVYVGTIGEWFDFELIKEAMSRFENLELVLVGPSEVAIPNHKNIHFLGPVAHADIFAYMGTADALIMPFMPIEAIMSVNPVKLYEYIYSGKAVVALSYPESEPFHEYVYLYRTKDEFLDLMKAVADGEIEGKKDLEECRKFVASNTWKNRVDQLTGLLDEVMGRNFERHR